jgi:hypothetical protein
MLLWSLQRRTLWWHHRSAVVSMDTRCSLLQWVNPHSPLAVTPLPLAVSTMLICSNDYTLHHKYKSFSFVLSQTFLTMTFDIYYKIHYFKLQGLHTMIVYSVMSLVMLILNCQYLWNIAINDQIWFFLLRTNPKRLIFMDRWSS